MLAIRVELLTGRYAATRFNDRNATEWPPHPARLYSALVATWADADVPDPHERAVLKWLEALDAPGIAASGAEPRSVVTYYVPNNEAASVVVADQAANYKKLVELGEQLSSAHDRLALGPDDKVARKEAEKFLKSITMLNQKVISDSAKGSAAKPADTEKIVRTGVQLLPEERGKQARTFPVVIPHDPVVHFIWKDAQPTTDQREQLDGLLGRVARLGHSSSMVDCAIVEDAPPPTRVPAGDGFEQLRVMAPGLLDELELSFDSHKGIEPRTLPSVLAGYGPPDEEQTEYPYPYLGDRWIVLTDVSDGKLPLTRTLDLTMAVRGALLKYAEEPIAEIISGHQPSAEGAPTGPSERPHLAVVPLAFVGHKHADGNIRGIGLVMPRDAHAEERAAVVEAVRRWIDASGKDRAVVQLGRSGVRLFELRDQLSGPAALQPGSWCEPSKHWVSTTPVALDRFPGQLWSVDRRKHDAAEQSAIETAKRGCEYVGLPRPGRVELVPSSPLLVVPVLRRFPVYQSPGRGVRRQSVHVRLWFEEPVVGPVLLGAGRYFGYGLCKPVGSRDSARGVVPVGKGDAA